MADGETAQQPANCAPPSRPRGLSKSQQPSKFYSLPAPVRTFPLPTFLPHNPISLFHILYTWISQTIRPPSSHPETLYQGWLSAETRSVHVTDPRSIKALWEQGFYGKGSLSRSELSWLDREKRRKGAVASKTSEEVTRQRRSERQEAKWERARKEREAIDQKLLEESGIMLGPDALVPNGKPRVSEKAWLAPVGPLEILALPNSSNDLQSLGESLGTQAPRPDDEINRLPNGHTHAPQPERIVDLTKKDDASMFNQQVHEHGERRLLEQVSGNADSNGTAHTNGSVDSIRNTNGSGDSPKQSKCQKSVRFSPNIEQTTFLQSEPPSPEHAATSHAKGGEPPITIEDQEHLQLMMEEAFFLSYGLGVLTVLDPNTKAAISPDELFSISRRLSYFPPSETTLVSTDDPFMLSYVVYHHFRSLGWVVRGGTKFSVDYLLYNRGPVFSHAEFAVLIFPSYSDPAWLADASMRDYVARKEKRSWSWLHCVNRVNSQVKKTLILVYVDIPPPALGHVGDDLGIDGVLKQYKIREFVLKRWLSNRSRD